MTEIKVKHILVGGKNFDKNLDVWFENIKSRIKLNYSKDDGLKIVTKILTDNNGNMRGYIVFDKN